MLRLYVPVAVTVVLIASLTAWESIYSDRFTGSSIDAAEFGKRFANLPDKVGPWVGTDNEVKEETLKMAGAVNHVSRTYRNSETNQEVDLWLIVGHARDVGRHTPDVCYPSHGFAQDGTKQKQSIEIPGEEAAMFHTARFKQESALGGGGTWQRVFWAWNPNRDDEKQWVAPDAQRLHFGNNTALYKMYFTAGLKERDEPVADNVAVEFAKVMLPEVNKTLFPERYGALQAPADGAAAATPAADAPATPPADAATPAA